MIHLRFKMYNVFECCILDLPTGVHPWVSRHGLLHLSPGLLGDCQGHVRNVVLGVFLVARDRLVVVEELLLPVVVFHCLVGDLSLASTGTIGANLGTGKPGTITPDR